MSKGKREIHAATCGSGGWPGPHYFLQFFRNPKNQPQRTPGSTEEDPQRNNEARHCIPLWLFSVFLCALCGNALELAPLHMLRKIALTFAFYSAYTFFWRDEGGCPHVKSADARAGVPAKGERSRTTGPIHTADAESGAIVSPQKSDFRFVFQSKFRSSTR